ncbi:hypothetical protein ACA910_000980 [Epithemia clementina (nom. ined.)]
MMVSTSDEHFEEEFGRTSGEDVSGSTANRRSGKRDHGVGNKLGMWQGVTLLTADCLGVGILALPQDIHVLGRVFGLVFLFLQLPINYYAGYILAWTATQVEKEWEGRGTSGVTTGEQEVEHSFEMTRTGKSTNSLDDDKNNNDDDKIHVRSFVEFCGEEEDGENQTSFEDPTTSSPSSRRNLARRQLYSELSFSGKEDDAQDRYKPSLGTSSAPKQGMAYKDIGSSNEDMLHDEESEEERNRRFACQKSDHPRIPAPTVDLVGITTAVFDKHPLDELVSSIDPSLPSHRYNASRVVLLIYYLNIFLVLGDYILVMSHAVAAVWEELCITTAGLIASLLMFAICQLNTMALLGQYVSMASLAAMAIVLGQCIWESHQSHATEPYDTDSSSLHEYNKDRNDIQPSVLRKFSALASICFAVGSQKLFLNIRYELHDKEKDASPVLAWSLFIYFMAYFLVILLSGSDPPSFLFDTIPNGSLNRRVGGLLLWGHVAVSYAINSQALCSSLERQLCNLPSLSNSRTARLRWLLLTFSLAVTSYLVANGIPFFKDLVALIGAATTVPLTLTLPPILYQHWQQWTRLTSINRRRTDSSASGVIQRSTTRNLECVSSSALLLYSVVFLGIGLAGALASVKRDWTDSGHPPFSCKP